MVRGNAEKVTVPSSRSLLVMTSLSGCVSRHLPDWSRMQAVKPDTKTEVRLYKNMIPTGGGHKFRGRFLSTTDDSVTLELTDRYYKDGQTRTFQKSNVRKVLTPRSISERG